MRIILSTGSWYSPLEKELPLSERERKQNRIRYYQWVPFLLLFQAILCYLPRLVWRTLNVKSGIDMINLVDAAIKYESVDKFADRDKIMAYMITNIERYIGARRPTSNGLLSDLNWLDSDAARCRLHRRRHKTTPPPSSTATTAANANTNDNDYDHDYDENDSDVDTETAKQYEPSSVSCAFHRRVLRTTRLWTRTVCFWTGKRLGNYLVVLYMFVKTLWLANSVCQLLMLNAFIGNNYHAFGVEIIGMLLSGEEWHELRHFPRVTFCDFKIREVGNSHDWTVQCVLRINLFNEVIYIFMWFWLCMLALATAADYVAWCMRLLGGDDKLRFVRRHLDTLPSSPRLNTNSNNNSNNNNNNKTATTLLTERRGEQRRLVRDFTFAYLKDDGVFVMRMLASNASDLIVTEIVSELWKNYVARVSAMRHRSTHAYNGCELQLVAVPLMATTTATTATNIKSKMIQPQKQRPARHPLSSSKSAFINLDTTTLRFKPTTASPAVRTTFASGVAAALPPSASMSMHSNIAQQQQQQHHTQATAITAVATTPANGQHLASSSTSSTSNNNNSARHVPHQFHHIHENDSGNQQQQQQQQQQQHDINGKNANNNNSNSNTFSNVRDTDV